jgi:hypothetical protein
MQKQINMEGVQLREETHKILKAAANPPLETLAFYLRLYVKTSLFTHMQTNTQKVAILLMWP